MKLHELKPAVGARKKRKRVGRGNASGSGTYCGTGMNGQNSRSNGGVRIGFEGGQTPLLRRIPKLKGFKNHKRIEYFPVNLALLEEIYKNDEIVNIETLIQKKVLKKKSTLIKVLGTGELTKKLKFDGLAFSGSAKKKIEKAGGEIKNEISTERILGKKVLAKLERDQQELVNNKPKKEIKKELKKDDVVKIEKGKEVKKIKAAKKEKETKVETKEDPKKEEK